MTCFKHAFSSFREASRVKRGHPYRCKHCGSWHLTSESRERFRRHTLGVGADR